MATANPVSAEPTPEANCPVQMIRKFRIAMLVRCFSDSTGLSVFWAAAVMKSEDAGHRLEAAAVDEDR